MTLDEKLKNVFVKDDKKFEYKWYHKVKDACESAQRYVSEKVGRAVVKVLFPYL